MSRPDVDEFVARFDDAKNIAWSRLTDDEKLKRLIAWSRLTDDEKLKLLVAATARICDASKVNNEVKTDTLADLQRVVATGALDRIAVLVNNARVTMDVAFSKTLNIRNFLDDVDAILDEHCHCGRANFTNEDQFTRFMCEPCTLVRCDAYPFPSCPELTEGVTHDNQRS